MRLRTAMQALCLKTRPRQRLVQLPKVVPNRSDGFTGGPISIQGSYASIVSAGKARVVRMRRRAKITQRRKMLSLPSTFLLLRGSLLLTMPNALKGRKTRRLRRV